MLHQLQDRRSAGRFSSPWTGMLALCLLALALVACTPGATTLGSSGASLVELEVGVAMDCDTVVAVSIDVDDTIYAFTDLELVGPVDSSLPYSGTVRVPWSSGASYRVTIEHGCGESRRVEITTYRVEGASRTILAKTTSTGRRFAGSSGSM